MNITEAQDPYGQQYEELKLVMQETDTSKGRDFLKHGILL